MAIAYIPNDPVANKPPLRRVQPRPNRAPGEAGFTFETPPPEKVYTPGSTEFLYWQSRQAALLTLELWEDLGQEIIGWEGKPARKRLQFLTVAGTDLNAYYDRDSVSFFKAEVAGKTFYSGASTDIVAHEVGHALLDSIRPDLFDSMFFEVNAFHEGFGDCIAVLLALSDKLTREELLGITADLDTANFVEATGEDLAAAVRKNLGVSHSAALPRRARNTFKWQFNDALPDDGPGNVLINEIHSFGQVFSGCFYDLIRNMYALETKGQAGLWTAVKAAGRLLAAATAKAPHVPRFMQSVGRTMVLEEEQLFGGRYRDAVRDAFTAHAVALGASAMLAPRASIGEAKTLRVGTRTAALSASSMTELKRHIGTVGRATVAMSPIDIGGRSLAEARHSRAVDLTGIAEFLTNVVAIGVEPVLLERAAGRAAILGAVPDAVTTQDEVRKFVESLVANKQIRRSKSARGGRSAISLGGEGQPTHEVIQVGGQRVLRRMRFACACCDQVSAKGRCA